MREEAKAPFFSVVIPVYNKEPHIARSIKSVLNQSFTDFELIIVCDPSTDNSNTEVSKFNDSRVKVLHRCEPGPGGYAARNLGINVAKAEWIAFLDADDEWYPEHLQKLHGLQHKYPHVGVMGCGCAAVEPESGNKLIFDGMYSKNKGCGDRYLSFKDYLTGEAKGLRPLNGTTACIKKKIFTQAGGFPAGKANRGGDVETWLRCIENAGGVAWGDYLGAVYYRDSVNMVTRTELFLAEVERETVRALLRKYTGDNAKLLKQVANRRTISAWRQNRKQGLENFNLVNKLYFFASFKQCLFWSFLSLLPKIIYNKMSKEKLRELTISFKKSLAGRSIKRVRVINNKIIAKPSFLGKRMDCAQVFLNHKNNPTFFGYHDNTPFSLDGTKILAMSVKESDKNTASECSPMKLGFFTKSDDGFSEQFQSFAETTTWCWQQGCMLQWSNIEPNRIIYFNKIINRQYGAVSFCVESNRTIKEFSYPIYSISGNDKYATTLNFSRLGRLRPGYGYPLIADESKGVKTPHDDGLFLLNLDTGERQLLVSLLDLSKSAGSADAEHYVNHATFSPDSKHIVFFHLWAQEGDKGRGLRACIYNLESKQWTELEAERIISHYCWKEESVFLASNRDENMQWHYTEFDLIKNAKTDLGLPFNQDGHPMFHPNNNNLIVTDTYPDKRRDQHLCIVDIDTKKSTEIATLYSPFAYQGQVRCDLHPRWDREGRYVVVDTTVRGRREMLVVDTYDK